MDSPEDHSEDSSAWKANWPGIPDPASLADEGADFPARLRQPQETSTGCAIIFLGVFTLIWNSVILTAFWHLIGRFQAGIGDICLGLFLIPFVLVGVITIITWLALLLQGLAEIRVGPVMTEMGPHPLRAGQRFTWQVVIPQQRHLNHWRVDVTCTERAVYTVATSSATHTHICYRKALRVPEELEMFDDQMALTGSTELPRDAMHSFSTKNNHVEWAIEVSGSVWGWFPVTFRFPFVLLPSETWT